MNIQDKSAIRNCTSCQMCAAVCAKDAISVHLDREGFYRPSVDEAKCVDCGLCTSVCYKFDESISASGEKDLSSVTLLGAYAKDEKVVASTTSGGVADLLARALHKDGYKCVGVVYDGEMDIAVNVVAESETDIDRFRGSKYIQSYTCSAFKQLVKECRNDKFAVFGTPCHIYAIDKYLHSRHLRDNVMLIDLFCHGCPSMNIWKKYVADIKKCADVAKIDNANFRSKVRDWGTFSIVAYSGKKPVFYSSKKNNEFFDLFFSDQVLNEACGDCKLRGTVAYTDIRLGDFWGKEYVLNHHGVSGVCLVSEKAKEFFKKISDGLVWKEHRFEDFLPWQSWGKEYHPRESVRKMLLEQLADSQVSLRQSVMSFHSSQSLKRKMVRYAKDFVQMLPRSVECWVRWVYYRIEDIS